MNLKQIKPAPTTLFVAGLFVLATGAYTTNGGLQLAGGILLVVSAVLALNQARHKAGNQ